MSHAIADLIERWDGEHVVCRHDAQSGAWMFVCVHSSRGGVAGGGTRMRVYPTPADGLADAMRLSSAMTRKFAAADFEMGGAKAVLAVPSIPEGDERRALLLRYADLVASLRGGFVTGPDMNVSAADVDVMRERSEHVRGSTASMHDGHSSARATAIGVLEGIRASVAFALGDGLAGRTVLVQGLGEVGVPLAEMLAQEGATLLVSDLDDGRARAVAERFGATTVPPDEALATECDVLAPCAVGGVIDGGLRCRIVAGSANNPLREPEVAEALHAAGILYAPDYVISGGGVIYALGVEVDGWGTERLLERLRGIGTTLTEIYESSAREGISTEAAAQALVAARTGGA